MANLNLFEPHGTFEPTHENRLTAAFLIVLRSVPVAHAAWLHLVNEAHRANDSKTGVPALHELPQAQIETQVGHLPERVARVVSVLQTDDYYFAERDVGPSARKQILDGVVSYAPHLAIAIENKLLASTVWEGQLSVNLGPSAQGEKVEHDPRVACVTWRSIIKAWEQLVQARCINGAERQLVEDFLEYVEKHFDRPQPYSTVGACGNSTYRLKRRCLRILEEIAPSSVGDHRNWGTYIELQGDDLPAYMIGFFPQGSDAALALKLEVALGDTQSQALRLYKNFSFERCEALVQAGWKLIPNFHCSFMSQNLFYPDLCTDPKAYWQLWTENLGWIRQWKRPQFEEFFGLLVSRRIARPEDRASFDKHFTATSRGTLNVCPGLVIRYLIPLQEAAELDTQGSLVNKVRSEMKRVVEAFALPLPSA